MTISRRDMARGAAFGLAAAPFLTLAAGIARADRALTEMTLEEAKRHSEDSHNALMEAEGMTMHSDEQVVMLLYPGFTALDLVGPQYMFASMMGATVHLVTNGADLAPVASDTKLAIQPTATMDDAPVAPTILFVPGSAAGIVDAMGDPRTLDFLADRGAQARYVTSVCTGSLILGMAGLLDGKRATSHWVTRPVLPEFGAIPVDARVVVDGNVITGAGVTAGLDFGLSLIAALRGQVYAEAVQLIAEYAPEPPFQAGTPQQAGPFLTERIDGMFTPLTVQARDIARARSG